MKRNFVLLCLLCVVPCYAGKGAKQRQARKRRAVQDKKKKKSKKNNRLKAAQKEGMRLALIDAERARYDRAAGRGRQKDDAESARLRQMTLEAFERKKARRREERLKKEREDDVFAQLLETRERSKAEPPRHIRLRAEKNRRLHEERIARKQAKEMNAWVVSHQNDDGQTSYTGFLGAMQDALQPDVEQ